MNRDRIRIACIACTAAGAALLALVLLPVIEEVVIFGLALLAVGAVVAICAVGAILRVARRHPLVDVAVAAWLWHRHERRVQRMLGAWSRPQNTPHPVTWEPPDPRTRAPELSAGERPSEPRRW